MYGYRWPGLLSQVAFFRLCQTTLVHYRACGATGGGFIKDAWGAKLLPTTISAYHIDYGCFCGLLMTACVPMDGITRLRLPTRPQHLPHPLPPVCVPCMCRVCMCARAMRVCVHVCACVYSSICHRQSSRKYKK